MPDGIPDRVSIREVGPRDGFQNEPEVIAADDKVRLVEMLAGTGLKRLEVTSFVRADVIPQLADGTEVLTRAEIPDDVSVSVLIPNERGLDNALQLRERIDEINVFLSASETHNRKNVNRSIEESLEGLERVLPRAREAGLRCEGVISTSFGCPYEGEVPPERVLGIAERLAAAGCAEVAFGDTTGMANPRQVAEFFAMARDGIFFRRSRPSFDGVLWQVVEFNCELALEQVQAGVPNFDEVWVGMRDIPLIGSVRITSSNPSFPAGRIIPLSGWTTRICAPPHGRPTPSPELCSSRPKTTRSPSP